MTKTASILRESGQELVITGNVHLARIVGFGNTRRTEPAEVTDLVATDLNGVIVELTDSELEHAEAELIAACHLTVISRFLHERDE